jgi:hypothetical protein
VALFGFLLGFGTFTEQFQSPIEKLKTNNAKLSEQFQSPIVKQIMAHCQNSSKVP